MPIIRPELKWPAYALGWILIFVAIGFCVDGWLVAHGRRTAEKNLLTVATTAAAGLNPDDVAQLHGELHDVDSEPYKAVRRALAQYCESNPRIRFAYLMREKDGEVVFLADAEPADSEDYSAPGDVYSEASPQLSAALMSGEGFVEGPLEDQWGTWVSGLAPIHDPRTGETLALLGLDIDASQWRQTIAVYRWLGTSVIIFLTLMTSTLTVAMCRVHRNNAALHREVADRKRAQAQLSLSAKVFETSGEAIIIADPGRNILSVNHMFAQLAGYEAEEIVGQPLSCLRSDRHDEAFYENLWRMAYSKGVWQGEVWTRRKGGEVFLIWMTAGVVHDTDGNVTHLIITASDMTEQKAVAERIRLLAYYDSLTNLPNRTLLVDRLKTCLARARRTGNQVGVLFLDLDRFKNINDSLGHRAGDLLLQGVAERIRKVIRDSDTVARMGGDEFVVIVPDAAQSVDIASAAQRIAESMTRPILVDGRELTIRASIGISVFPGDGQDADALMKHADVAMYRCKANGQAAYRFFTPDMNANVLEKLTIENELRKALRENRLCLYFQPQIDARTGQLVGAEALVRWQHPQRGLLMPGHFISVAEETGLIVQLGEWILHEACRHCATWEPPEGCEPLSVAVNISAAQFQHQGFRQTIVQALADNNLNARRLELELTESAIVEDVAMAAACLADMKAMGVQVAIDDFGTGYSSLSALKRFPIDRLKIDRSFVSDLASNEDDAAITMAIIALARSLQLKVLAEGVETQQQLDFLWQHECYEMQGYFFARPMPAEQFAAWLQSRQAAGVC
ncbi:MAG: EAL domain-containing protein [Planctomycetes bacterium]|nr:EAL domain-containing protein [Planctomycetota bacterium]